MAVFLRYTEKSTVLHPSVLQVLVCLYVPYGSIPKAQGKSTVLHPSVLQVLVCLYVPYGSIPKVHGKIHRFSPQCAPSSGVSICALWQYS